MKAKILLIEDNPINIVVIKKFVEAVYDIDTITSGRKIDAQLSQNSYQLILTDINLGDEELSGIEVMHQIRKQSPLMPIIAITAYSMATDIDRFREQGFTDFISKPINKANLLAVLAKYLS
jgi:CheY-like chemotaxis protein